jgi:hypothetical protein
MLLPVGWAVATGIKVQKDRCFPFCLSRSSLDKGETSIYLGVLDVMLGADWCVRGLIREMFRRLRWTDWT